MARKSRTKFNIDKLRICFKQPNGLFETLYTSILKKEVTIGGKIYLSTKHKEEKKETQNNNFLIPRLSKEEEKKGVKNDFILYIRRENEVKETDKKEDIPTDLEVSVLLPTEKDGKDMLFGNFHFTNSKKYEGLCWLTLENQAFYRNYKNVGAYSFVYYLNSIAYNLNLIYNNTTEIEICADSTNNIDRKLRRLIKDHSNYEMILNGKKITDPFRKIENYHESFSRSREKLIPSPTLYFEQVKKDAPLMRVYNKSLEIADNKDQKNYIEEWDNFGKMPIHRAEIRLKNESIKQAWEKFTENLPDDEPMKQADGITQMLDDENFLVWIWREYTNRLVTFNDPNGEKITMYDLATA